MNQTSSNDNSQLVVITGASSGIGKATATRLAKAGYRTVVAARRVDRLDDLADELSQYAPSTAFELDLLNRESVSKAITSIESKAGSVDVLINNGGSGFIKTVLDHTDEDFQNLLEMHYLAPARLIQQVLPGMLERGRGHIINVTSIASKFGPWGHGGYAAAKSAMVSLTQTLAVEHADSPVHFSYVNPGIVKTEFFDSDDYKVLAKQIKRHGISPRRIAKNIEKLLKKPKLEMCIPPHYRIIDLIKAISPALAFRIVGKASQQEQ